MRAIAEIHMGLEERESIRQEVIECTKHPKKGDLYWEALNSFLWYIHRGSTYEMCDRTDELLAALSESKNKDVINFIRLINYIKAANT